MKQRLALAAAGVAAAILLTTIATPAYAIGTPRGPYDNYTLCIYSQRQYQKMGYIIDKSCYANMYGDWYFWTK